MIDHGSELSDGVEPQSIFDCEQIGQYSRQNIESFMKTGEFEKLLEIREECLKIKEREETRKISQLLCENQMTPRTFK